MGACSERMQQQVLVITAAAVVLCLGVASAFNGPSLRGQASILVSLKQGFGTPTHPFLDSWELSNYKSFCSWNGVKCDDHGNFVVSIDISNLNLSGSFSPVITELVSLRNLSISGNNFSCPFPSQIHKIHTLQFLNISNNGFNGSLEWDFSLMKELQTLDAYNNGFEGSLPKDVIQLEYMDLGGNYFSGEIPKSYGSMEKLKYLSLAGNDLNGSIPGELGKLTNLTRLRLGYYNNFVGSIPSELGNLVNLVLLDLANCGLEGEIPSELGKLNQLDTLFLQFNQLTGSIPPQLGNLTRLKSLDVSNNGLTGEVPPQLSSLRSLTVLNLFMNKFHGEIPGFVAEFPSLQVLQLWKNNFTGSIPSKLGQNGELVELDLSTNKLTGLVPKLLCLGRKLQILILLHNFVFGPLPDDLARCDTLVRVRLGQNYLSGSLPIGFIYLPQLSLLELQNNYLTGRIHEANGSKQASNFTQLNLSNNQFSGSLPASIGNLSSLKIILLSGNHFTGEIPTQIGQLKNAVKLDLSRNNFSGTIPSEIGNCLMLTSLDLSQNQLSGPIPTQITRVRVLNYLNVSSNQLSHSLPKEIGSMKSLTTADFSHNNFSGMIPETGRFLLFNYTSFVGNPFLCGPSFKPCNQTPGSALESNENHHGHKSFIRLSGKFKLVLALALFVCSLVFVVMAFIKTRKWRSNANSWRLTAFQKLSFNSEDILECLNDNNIIGKGGAGIVYRGITPSGEQVAVKKLLGIGSNKLGSSHHDHGFSAEIQTLGNIRHRNIVRLLAFCSNKETNLLVYEYMPNGSLGEILHGKRGGHLKWDIRLKVAIEAAKGLCYLHHDCSPLIVHRDVKSNNILLDSDFEAHVADFGLAKFLNPNNGASECMSAIAGSYGYIAPEYAYTLKVDEKSDVYSFGVVLLELLTGKRPVGDFEEEGLDIVQWTKMQTNGNKERAVKIIDERLQDVPVVEAMQVFFVAMLCVQEQSVERPTMREVVQMLAQAKQPDTFQMQ